MDSTKKKRELPPLFYFMESGDLERATERVRKHPREVKTWATLRSKEASDTATKTFSTSSKRLALHHACFKLRSAGSAPPAAKASDDLFIQMCRFILLLIRLYPEAASQRESRHGCLPLHLAAFASCAPRTAAEQDAEVDSTSAGSVSASAFSSSTVASAASPLSTVAMDGKQARTGGGGGAVGQQQQYQQQQQPFQKPGIISRRVASDATAGTTETAQTNMSAIHAEETYTGGMNEKGVRQQVVDPNVSVAMTSNIIIHPKREEMAVQVINALLDAYPKGIRVDSEGGRLPLHTAVAGRATPRVIATLVTAYPAAARHRNKDGFLPLHLAAHWGVSHPNVAIALLKAYPDATLGRNRWERTPLEEALCMAGENGRPHQGPLVRALRKHPTYWTRPSPDVFEPNRSRGAPVDVDESLPSNESSQDEERRYLQYGQSGLARLDDAADIKESPSASSLLHSPASPGRLLKRFASNKPKREEKKEDLEELELNVDLATLIQNRRWRTLLARLSHNPLEAEQDLNVMTRGGFVAASGFTPLHYVCERRPPVEVVNAMLEAFPTAVMTRTMPGGCLPLHVACTWYATSEVVAALLTADQGGASVTDELGNVALHSACFSGADESVIFSLLAAQPRAVLSRNKQGSRPIDICKRLRHANRRSVMHLLTLKKDELLHRHRRSASSGTWSDAALEAAELNERVGEPTIAVAKFSQAEYRDTDELQEEHGLGVEVTYSEGGDSNNDTELLWI